MTQNSEKEKFNGNAGETAASSTQAEEQYLTFTLAGEDYGVNILSVEEIRGLDKWTRIPNSPTFIRGVVNIRGAIVPVLDLRERFDLEMQDYGSDAVIIVLRGKTSRGNRALGVVADAVSDVHDASQTQVGNTPEFGHDVSTEFIAGLATASDKMIMLLDVDKLLNHPDITGVAVKATAA